MVDWWWVVPGGWISLAISAFAILGFWWDVRQHRRIVYRVEKMDTAKLHTGAATLDVKNEAT